VVDLDFPYAVDTRGQTATASPDDHLRDLIGQVLFTAPGERVNRPAFGCGLPGLVFEPGGPEIAAATQLQAHGALQQWLGDIIEVQDVSVEMDDAVLRVQVRYLDRRTQQARLAEYLTTGENR
jgi:phage baseplate assembly protein W